MRGAALTAGGARGLLIGTLLAAAACSSTPPSDGTELRTLLALPSHLQVPAVPAGNPLTKAKITLGRRLFYDQRLSGNQTQACASCHLQRLAFSDNKKNPSGSTGHVLRRNSPGLANVAYYTTLSWANNNMLELEDLLPVPIRGDDPPELGVTDGNEAEVLSRFSIEPTYQVLFQDAFPDSPSGVTINKIVFALASFCRTLISGDSAYDRYLAGDDTALTAQQRHGLALFQGERFECFHCHRGTNLSVSYRDAQTPLGSLQYPFFNNGLYNVDGQGSYPGYDEGLFDVTFNRDHRGRFRPPNLRNVALTAPYMHDGSIATLREVVQHYAAGGRVISTGPYSGDGRISPLKSTLIRGFQATDEELDDTVSFLESLTDQTFITNPAFADPG